MTIALAAILRPLLYVLIWGAIAIPLAFLLRRFIPPGKIKEFLYKERK